MPIHEYIAREDARGCARCRAGFERLERPGEAPLATCPECGSPVRRKISAPTVGRSASSLDHRAKAVGFHKLKRLGKGEYEKQY